MNDTYRFNSVLGWSLVAAFMAFGLFLESLHLFKATFYFEVEIRRELWVLAHAHGVLLALTNIVFANWAQGRGGLTWASRLFAAAAVLMPAGFLLGGIGNSESDPSLAILATPLGALAAIVAALLCAMRRS